MRTLLTVAVAVLLLSGCGGGSDLTPRSPTLTALGGSSLDGVSLLDRGSAVVLSFETVTADGAFVHLELPDGRQLADLQQWANDEVLGLAAAAGDGIDVGIVSHGGPIAASVELPLVAAGTLRQASVPPVGDYNVITDLTVSDASGDQVLISWTQTNIGDYDFDGLVGVSDLTPIGQLLGKHYNRAADSAAALREYWVDGNADGAITVSDITPIGQNYGAYIAGYIIKRDGSVIQSTVPGEPTVLRSEGQSRDGLPPLFSLMVPGSPTDDWAVVAVDKDGIEGSGSGGIVGDVSLRANLDITGLELFDLDGTSPGPFAPSKGGSRLIEPIEIIGSDRWEAPGLDTPVRYSGTTIEFIDVPRLQTIYLDVFYLPVVYLATGEPREVASARIASSQLSPQCVISAVPFSLPELGTVQLDVKIAHSPNPAGGYFTELTVQSLIPGDNPETPNVEDGYATLSRSRLAHATGLVSYDTDLDGSFADEAELLDSDLDGVSDARLAQDIATGGALEECGELKLEGTLVTFIEHVGEVTLSETVITEGGEGDVPDPLLILISELTRFEEHIRTDEGVIMRDIDPSDLTAGDLIEVTMICLEEPGDPLPEIYWIEKLMRKIDERT